LAQHVAFSTEQLTPKPAVACKESQFIFDHPTPKTTAYGLRRKKMTGFTAKVPAKIFEIRFNYISLAICVKKYLEAGL